MHPDVSSNNMKSNSKCVCHVTFAGQLVSQAYSVVEQEHNINFERVFDAYVMFTINDKLEIKTRPSTIIKISELLAWLGNKVQGPSKPLQLVKAALKGCSLVLKISPCYDLRSGGQTLPRLFHESLS